MDPILKMLENEKFKFSQQNPLADLELKPAAVFPTVLAIRHEEEMSKILSGKKIANKTSKTIGAVSKPQGQEIDKKEMETTTYSLVYFNPELKKADVIEGSVSLAYEDETQQVIEESLGQRSAQGIYSHVASPIIREGVDEVMLQKIMERIKVESPDPFGGGAAVQIAGKKHELDTIEEFGDKLICFEIADQRKKTVEDHPGGTG
ncbi:hypothetical protein KJ780_03520 [Candidatus Micrarchaeota archaeon]|nr:hypothetical protein [Candidatus Micrarchaeota archaeon]